MVAERQWMRWLLFFVTTLILNLPLLSRAETASPDTHTGETGSTRSITAEKLSDEVVKFLSEHFGLPESYIRSKFEPSLPRAIEALKSGGDETAIATEIAFLMGRVNNSQIDKIIADAQAAITAEEAKADAGKDTRKIDLMKRLLWAAKIRAGTPSTADGAAKFKEKFDPEFAKVDAVNKEILEKIKQASSPEGNAQASKWLRENLSGEALASFVEAQRKTGNTSLSNEIMFGIAAKLPDGQRFVDFHGADGQGERLYLGKTVETAAQAVDKLFANNESKGKGRGFGGSLTTGADHPNDPPRQWFVDPTTGEFKTGAPAGVTPNPPPAQIREDQRPNESAKFEQLKTLITTSCQGCHSTSVVGGTSVATAMLSNDGGTPVPLTTALSNAEMSRSAGARTQLQKIRDFMSR